MQYRVLSLVVTPSRVLLSHHPVDNPHLPTELERLPYYQYSGVCIMKHVWIQHDI